MATPGFPAPLNICAKDVGPGATFGRNEWLPAALTIRKALEPPRSPAPFTDRRLNRPPGPKSLVRFPLPGGAFVFVGGARARCERAAPADLHCLTWTSKERRVVRTLMVRSAIVAREGNGRTSRSMRARLSHPASEGCIRLRATNVPRAPLRQPGLHGSRRLASPLRATRGSSP
jgi:hypothetical protein